MTTEYRLELDIPYTELEEQGWAKERLLRDINPAKNLKLGDNLYYESKTGTLMLMPVNLDPVAWHSGDTDALRLTTSDLDYEPSYWQMHPITGVPGGTHQALRSGGFTLIELLVLTGIAGISSALLSIGRQLEPVLATKDEFAINEGVHARFEMYGQPGLAQTDWAGVRFGDFLLSLHTDGGMDLYWSSDGTCEASSWVHRKSFSTVPDVRHGVSVMGANATPRSVINLYIIPFGRGNIWFILRSGGKTFSDVYSHPEAAWNSGEQRHRITKAGKVVILVSENDQKNVGVSIAKVGYKESGEYIDTQWTIPYAPTEAAELTPEWTKTIGSPSVTAELLNEDGDAWVSDGAQRKCKVKLTLTGDGTCSPFVDAYHLRFPELLRHYNPATITVPQGAIEKIDLEDGEDWDSQSISISIKDRGEDSALTSALMRSQINGRLSVVNDGSAQTLMLAMFKEPRIVLGRRFNQVQLQGKNWGVARVEEKRFFWPKTYGGWSHGGAVRDILQKCGWQEEDIVVLIESVNLPATSLQGQGTDGGESEIKSQPEFNSPVVKFLEWIQDTFSNWPLRFKPDGKWYYLPAPIPTTAAVTFYPDRSPMYEELSCSVVPPAANLIYIIGQKDNGELIANYAMDTSSIVYALDPKPMNYLGRIKQAIYIDLALNDMDTLDAALGTIFEAGRHACIEMTWTAPFRTEAQIDAGVMVDGVGLVQLKSFSASAEGITQLEKTPSTQYTGVLVSSTRPGFPTIPAYVNTYGMSKGMRKRFFQAVEKMAAAANGTDSNVQRKTTGQTKDEQEVSREILRGNVEWGEPIVV